MLVDIIRFRAWLNSGAAPAATNRPVVSNGPRDFVHIGPLAQ